MKHRYDVYRFGGEEFVAFLYDDTKGSYLETVQGLKKAIHDLQIPHAKEHGMVSISIGVCPYLENLGFDEVIKRADQALYEVKHKGRNRIEIHIEKK